MPHPTSASSTGSHRLPRRRAPRRYGLLLAGVAAALVVGAGAGIAVNAAPAPATAPVPVAAVTAAPALGAQGTPAGLNLAAAPSPLGTVVTNDGFTVYRFERDTARPSASNCTGSCEQAWPPVLASDVPWLKGVPSDEVGTVDRPDGSRQLTLGGWPIYRYAQDTAPGDTRGQGVGGTWCAIGPDGRPAAGGSETSTPSSSSSAPAAAPADPAPATGSGYGSGGGYSSGGSGSGY